MEFNFISILIYLNQFNYKSAIICLCRKVGNRFMVKIDIISGFLGAGKTTFIERLLTTKLKDEKVCLIENEYGEISIDTDLIKEKSSKIEVRELAQGCICCSLVGDFSKSLKEVIRQYNPDRIIIEPSGVGKLSDIVKAVVNTELKDCINSLVCMVDAKKAKMYDRNFGEFFIDQIANAQTVILSRTDICDENVVKTALDIVRSHNSNCVVVTTPIKNLSDEDLLKAYEGIDEKLISEDLLHHHHDDDEECDDPNCSCHHHHHHDDDEEEGHHHHHHHHDGEECDDPECECHHHHDDDDEDEHEHHHHHHHHHDADEVFESVGIETVKKYDLNELKSLLDEIADGKYGLIVRSKGIIMANDNKWYVFNLTPGEVSIEESKAIHMGKIVVIGSKIDADKIKKLF